MSRSPRAASRRSVLKVLSTVKQAVRYLDRDWKVRASVWEQGAYRPRTVEEYPENRAEDWTTLIEVLDDMITGLTGFREFALEQRDEVERLRMPQETPLSELPPTRSSPAGESSQ